MINEFWKATANLLMLCSIVLLTSCGNDRDLGADDGVITPEEESKNPPVITFDNGTGIYPVKILKEITITPIVDNAIAPVYTWKDENGKIVSTEASFTYSSPADGKKFFTFRVDAKNGSAQEELRIDVMDKMVPSVSLIQYYSTYVGESITIKSAVNFTEGNTYEWTNEKGAVIGDKEEYTFVAENEGSFHITLKVTNEDGTGKATTTIRVAPERRLNITFENERQTVPAERAACVAPIITDNTENTTYAWEVNGEPYPDETKPTFTFTPPAAGEYKVKVTGTDGDISVEAIQTIECLQSDEAAHYRAPKAGSSNSKVKVYNILPAPGQFVQQISGKTEAEACRYAETRMNEVVSYVSLGAWGGYIVVGFDHSVYNASSNDNSQYDFSIIGNAFNGNSEPGIVYVMQDENGNGLPDDTWYELKGSETGKSTTWQNYSVTYYRPPIYNMPVQWIDNRGNTGTTERSPAFPSWLKGNSYELRGTRIKERTFLNHGIWRNESYGWGYADNYGEDFLSDGDNHDANAIGNGFKIKNAIYPDGTPINLRYIDFIKVQTGVQSQAGVLGELSTEVHGFRDIQMEKAPGQL